MLAFILLFFTSSAIAAGNVEAIGFSLASPLFKSRHVARSIDTECAASAVLSILPERPTQTEFAEWGTASSIQIPACTITAPANLSSDYMSYDKAISTFFSTAKSAASNAKYTCGDGFGFSFSVNGGFCTTSRTVLFTDGSQTETAVLARMTDPGTITFSGAAGRIADASRFLPFVAVSAVLLVLAI